jgi:ATP-dependent DNA helicase RecQ
MSADPHSLLRDTFGLADFRPGQLVVIEALLAGRSALAVFPTGGGKSLCYQLPALLLDGLTLVISPLIALMKDQVDAMKLRGVAAERLDSSLSADESMVVMNDARSGKLKLLYVAPERLSNERFLEFLKSVNIALLAIDEAHCISEWGHNFRPDYLKLGQLAMQINAGGVLALTATATPSVSQDICRAFAITDEDHVQTGFRRPNLTYRVTPCSFAERKKLLVERLNGIGDGAAIVYVTQQQTAEAVAGFLRREGFSAKSYHAGLPDDFRSEVQEGFMGGSLQIVVATIAFGMGIDKSDIRAIFHYNLPKSLENYMQETGRAGRDGEPSYCEMLACADDRTVLENFIYGDTPSPQALRSLVDSILRLGEEFDISKYELSIANDIRPLVIGTILTYLELRGIIETTRPFYSTYRVKYVRGLPQLLAGYDEERKDFLQRMFAAGKAARIWTLIDPAEISLKIGEPRERIQEAITYLEEAVDLVVQPSGLRQGYRKLSDPGKLDQLAAEFYQMFEEREARDIERLDRVTELATYDGCLVRYLMEYFGETLKEDCGACSRCLGELVGDVTLPRAEAEPMTDEEVELVHALIKEKRSVLKSPRQMARFLCGISSPASTRARLSRHDNFALLERVPFTDVRDFLDSLTF